MERSCFFYNLLRCYYPHCSKTFVGLVETVNKMAIVVLCICIPLPTIVVPSFSTMNHFQITQIEFVSQ